MWISFTFATNTTLVNHNHSLEKLRKPLLNNGAVLDNYLRYQQGLKMHDVFPSIEGECSCGCGRKLTGKQKRWATPECSSKAYEAFAILKGNTGMIRKLVFERDNGFCHSCGAYEDDWQVDHILEVRQGGGACGLDNFQTLCPSCHEEKTSATSQVIENKKRLAQFVYSVIALISNQRASHHKEIS